MKWIFCQRGSRIKPRMRRSEEVGREHPDLRLGQRWMNGAGDKEWFNLEDDELMEAMERFGDEDDIGQIL